MIFLTKFSFSIVIHISISQTPKTGIVLAYAKWEKVVGTSLQELHFKTKPKVQVREGGGQF